MAFDQDTRNRLQRFVTETRELLVKEFTYQLQYEYGMDPVTGEISDLDRLTHLDDSRRETARLLRDTLDHYTAGNPSKKKECLERIVREQAFTVLNRLCALRMAEARGILIESIANGYNSNGFQLYIRLAGMSLGETGEAYRCYLFSLFDELALDLPVLFDRFSPQGRLFPRESVLLELIEKINHPEIAPLWSEDETIGWIYQYFNSAEERRAMRSESRSPRNSRELAVRNQFFTPRYVVEFLTDNTLGRIWYEMTQGNTVLKDQCRYLVRRPNEIFLSEGEKTPVQEKSTEGLSQEELLKLPVYIPFRRLKDPRDIRMLDPACGSMHFGLYAFDLFEKIYEEAWELEGQRGPEVFVRSDELKPLRDTYESKEALLLDVPRLIIEYNIHGIDIDPRAVQIAGLSLWLRAQRSWKEQGVKPQDRPRIRKSNVVCAEPMPGDQEMLREFTQRLQPRVLGQLVEKVFKKMELAGEAGSLLKIEEEIEEAVSEAREKFNQELLRRKATEGELFPETLSQQQQSLYDFSDLPDDTTFWNQAESEILQALREYAEQAEGMDANRKRLFAQDTARGFAFIGICRQRYDVVLMNPPFGASSRNSKIYIEEHYPHSKGDLLANFVERALELSKRNGKVGAISSRTPFFLGTYEAFRKEVIYKKCNVDLMADLGENVLEAMVETASYILSSGKHCLTQSIFIRLLIDDDKGNVLQRTISKIKDGSRTGKVFIIDIEEFSHLSGMPFTYWVSSNTIKKLSQYPKLEGNKAVVRVGLQTGDDFRFLRLLWEIDPNLISPSPVKGNINPDSLRNRCLYELSRDKCWVPYSKTDYASPWFSPITLVCNWRKNGREIKNFTDNHGRLRSRPQNESQYFNPGISYMLRSTRLVPYLVPAGIMPTAGRSQVFPFSNEEYVVLAICASNIGSAVARFYGGKFAWPTFQASLVQNLPAIDFSSEIIDKIRRYIDEEVNNRRKAFQSCEPFQEFTLPTELHSIKDESTSWNISSLLGKELENIIASCYGLNSDQLAELERDISEAVSIRGNKEIVEDGSSPDNDELSVELIEQTSEDKAAGLLSYSLGCCFGRWDIRIAVDPSLAPKLPGPFDALPVCPPGMLVGPDGLPAKSGSIVSEEWLRARPNAVTIPHDDAVKNPTITDTEYPLHISWNGILVDDEGHPEDIVGRVREAMEVIWKDKAGDIEQETCEILGVQSLRDYFRRPSHFFADHLKRYSKSRRQAPIYWPISTPSGSYTLWLYYHRLTDQTLYTCVNDFIEPKLKQVAESAARLRQKTDRSRAEERELERLMDLELELRDFRDELLKIASFWKPNLNDGVQITAAPLWKFFRHTPWQRKLKETWQKLERGEYDWAHLAYSIWPDRVREKCKRDKSLAIAHDLEDLYEEQPAGTRRTRGRRR